MSTYNEREAAFDQWPTAVAASGWRLRVEQAHRNGKRVPISYLMSENSICPRPKVIDEKKKESTTDQGVVLY